MPTLPRCPKDNKLVSAAISIKGHTAADLRAAWPNAVENERQDVYILDRARHVRAEIAGYSAQDPVEVTIRAFIPLATLIDADPTKFAGHIVIGRPLAEVVRELSPVARSHNDKLYWLLPTEYSRDDNLLRLLVDDAGRVAGWELSSQLHDPTDAMFKEVLDVYEKAWGEGRVVNDVTAAFGTKPYVRMHRRYGAVTVSTDNPDAD